METWDGSPHFFKIMVGDFAKRLYLPPAFAQKIRSEIGNGKDGVLQGPRGMRWDVKLFCTSDGIALSGAGWEIFIHRHAIEFGDLLVFKYIYGTYFRVRIFGKSGCQKDIPIIHSEKDCELQRKCPDHSTGAVTSSDPLMNRKSSVKLKRKSTPDAENEVKKPKLSAQSRSSDKPEHFNPYTEKEHQTVKYAKTKNEERRRKIRAHYVSSRRPVSTTEKEKALKAAKSFVSENPFDLIIMRPSMVYHEFRLRTRKAFIDKLELPRKITGVTLVDPNRREWPVRFLGKPPSASMLFGWRCFSIANNLEEGDACVFERVNDCKKKIKLDVHIFPVVKECTPYKYSKDGKGINSSLPAITKNRLQDLCNDFSTNLPEKAFVPDKRKCTKQGIEQLQGEKEKPSNGSKCVKPDTLKCKPSIPERRASCRRSLRLGQASHLAKCPKKKVWDDKDVVILS